MSDFLKFLLERKGIEAPSTEKQDEYENALVALSDRSEKISQAEPYLNDVPSNFLRGCMRNAMMEVFSNAIEHGAQCHHPIRIQAATGENGFLYWVEDPGNGISEDRLQQLAFGQYHNEHRGNGMTAMLGSLEYRVGFERIPRGFRTLLLRTAVDGEVALYPFAERLRNFFRIDYQRVMLQDKGRKAVASATESFESGQSGAELGINADSERMHLLHGVLPQYYPLKMSELHRTIDAIARKPGTPVRLNLSTSKTVPSLQIEKRNVLRTSASLARDIAFYRRHLWLLLDPKH